MQNLFQFQRKYIFGIVILAMLSLSYVIQNYVSSTKGNKQLPMCINDEFWIYPVMLSNNTQPAIADHQIPWDILVKAVDSKESRNFSTSFDVTEYVILSRSIILFESKGGVDEHYPPIMYISNNVGIESREILINDLLLELERDAKSRDRRIAHGYVLSVQVPIDEGEVGAITLGFEDSTNSVLTEHNFTYVIQRIKGELIVKSVISNQDWYRSGRILGDYCLFTSNGTSYTVYALDKFNSETFPETAIKLENIRSINSFKGSSIIGFSNDNAYITLDSSTGKLNFYNLEDNTFICTQEVQ